jgi:hypothetical protein
MFKVRPPGRRRCGALVGAACGVALLVGPAGASAALQPLYVATGPVSLSQNGYASNTGPLTKPIVKPSAGATVANAFLFAAAVPSSPTVQSGDITIDGTPVTFNDVPVTSSFDNTTREADVTSIVKPVLDAAPQGNVDFTLNEVNNTFSIDGEILAVVFNDPTVSNNTVTLMYGTQSTTGDTFHVAFAQPIDLSKSSIQFALGISYSYEPAGQFSLVDVNGTPPNPSNPVPGPDPARLTTSAGGQDDEVPGCDNNGCLLTVGGVGDSLANPVDPFATDLTCGASPAYRCDDELYTLGTPFVKTGDTSMSVYTLNPSNDDDILYSSFVFNGLAAIVGEGIVLAPPTQTNAPGGTATVDAHVQDNTGNPVAGATVTFTVTAGPNTGKTGTGVTDINGNASFSYSSTVTGTDTVSASFVDNMGATKTSNNVSVTWASLGATRPTSTAVACSPTQLLVGRSTTCTATVTGATNPTAHPTGSVSFASNTGGAFGTFSTTTCTLASIGGNQTRCSISFTPHHAGPVKIYADYSGDAANASSHSSTTITAANTSTTVVGCQPSSVPSGTPSTCVATVTGGNHPTGTVSFASNVGGTFSSLTCTLILIGGNQSRCSVTFTPNQLGTVKIWANYSGDASSPPSAGTTTFTAT